MKYNFHAHRLTPIRFTGHVSRLLLLSALLLGLTVMGAISAGAAQNNVLKGYPKAFTETGTFDDMGSGAIVIDDRSYPLSTRVSFNMPGKLKTSPASLPLGSRVGFIIGEDGKVESVWLLPDGVQLE